MGNPENLRLVRELGIVTPLGFHGTNRKSNAESVVPVSVNAFANNHLSQNLNEKKLQL
jgi:hypothetical protein